MSEENELLKLDRQERIPSEPVTLECGEIFDPELLNRPDPEFLSEMDSFLSDPMRPLIKILAQSLEAIKPPKAFEMVQSEHKVKIFRMHALMKPKDISSVEATIEAILNEGYCCHIPTVCNDFLIMDFSRRKETEENEREQ
jgi:hypothetical protein